MKSRAEHGPQGQAAAVCPCKFALLLAAVSLFLGARPCESAGYKVSRADQNWDFNYPYKKAALGNNNWYMGSATFYDLSGNTGACGEPWSVINKIDYAAVPDPRFRQMLTAGVRDFKGAACGQCYQVKCINVPRYGRLVFCKNNKAITVRITDYDVPGTRPYGLAWPNNHFDLKPNSFDKIAHKQAGIVNIVWRRVSCGRKQIKWTRHPGSNPFWHDLVIYDVPGVGSIHAVHAKPSNRDKWYVGKRTWGTHFTFTGQHQYDRDAKVIVYLGERKGKVYAKYGQTY